MEFSSLSNDPLVCDLSSRALCTAHCERFADFIFVRFIIPSYFISALAIACSVAVVVKRSSQQSDLYPLLSHQDH